MTIITHLKTAVPTKILNSYHNLLKEENATEKFYGLIHHLAQREDQHWQKIFTTYKYYKLFNRNNVKINYSCVQNMASVIQNYNTNLLKDTTAPTVKECSCQQKSRKFSSECLVYHAQVDRSDINYDCSNVAKLFEK